MSLNVELTALAGLANHETPGTWDLSASPHFPRTRVIGYCSWFRVRMRTGDWNSIIFVQ